MIRRAIAAMLGALARRLHCVGLRADIAGWEDDLARMEDRQQRNAEHEAAIRNSLAGARAELRNILSPHAALEK
jgi:hypothetical protein